MPTLLLVVAAVHLSEFTFLLFLCQKTPCIYVVQCAWYRCRSLLACAWSVRAPTCIRCGNFHHKTNFLLFLFKKIYTNSKLNKIWLSFALKCRLRCLYSFTWCRIFFLSDPFIKKSVAVMRKRFGVPILVHGFRKPLLENRELLYV